jgi:hypothetical protein
MQVISVPVSVGNPLLILVQVKPLSADRNNPFQQVPARIIFGVGWSMENIIEFDKVSWLFGVPILVQLFPWLRVL